MVSVRDEIVSAAAPFRRRTSNSHETATHPSGQPRGGRRSGGLRTVLAWGVHFYTALGLVAAAGVAVLIVEGTGTAFRWAFVLMLAATLVDATDGTLARAVKVKEVLPGFDGRRLDDLIDFLNYTFLPLFLIWRASLLPVGHEYWLLLPLLASPTASARRRRKPTTATSSASRPTGTWWHSTSTRSNRCRAGSRWAC